jgi:hypothetical protein
MKNFEIRMIDKEGYKKRSTSSIVMIIIIAIVLSAIVSYISNIEYGIGFGVIFCVIQFLKSSRWDKYFIRSILMNSEEVEIVYTENGEEKKVKDSIGFFKFSKKSAISKTRIIYLAIYYKDSLIIEQSEQDGWNETKFDEILSVVKS